MGGKGEGGREKVKKNGVNEAKINGKIDILKGNDQNKTNINEYETKPSLFFL